ncbi:MAG: single-stranded DNA-binding protein [Bacteroidales bacterium]|nr:single-stranded DNA-binding protein [Bacteroidales bacterium]
MSLNKVMLIGNVGKDPEIRYLDGNNPNQGATKVAQFTLATTERYRDRNGELRENTEWHNIVAWRNSADVAEKFIRRGTQLYVEGKLRTRSWTDQSGNKRFTTEVAVDNLQLLGKRTDNPGAAESDRPVGERSRTTGPSAPSTGSGTGYQPQQPVYQQPVPQQPAPQQPIDLSIGDNPSDDLPF